LDDGGSGEVRFALSELVGFSPNFKEALTDAEQQPIVVMAEHHGSTAEQTFRRLRKHCEFSDILTC
jgi:hypothetical protein